MQQSQSATQNKILFRKKSKIIRKELFQSGKLFSISKQIVNNIKKLDCFMEAENILLFYPKEDEIDLRELFFEDKNFFLPKCNESKLDICPFKNGDDLDTNIYKIYEPKTEPISDLSMLDVILIPALCVDKNFNRIGYGGGFYDRFLANKAINATKIITIPDELLYDNIPKEETDIKSDIIVTQSQILNCNIS